MADNESNDDETLVAKGYSEKKKIQDQLVKNQKEKISTFFHEFRRYCKNSTTNRQNELALLFRELDKTLSTEDKEILINRWRPVTPPIILVSTISQINDICTHLSGLDLSRVSFAQNSLQQYYQTQRNQANQFDELFENIEDCLDLSQSPTSTFTMNSEMCIERQGTTASSVIQSTIEDNQLPNMVSDSSEMEQSDIFSNSSEETASITNTETLEESLFHRLYSLIEVREDIFPSMNAIKETYGSETYRKVFEYCGSKEPLLFHLACDCDRYKSVLDQLREEDILNLNQRDSIKASIFSFLLIKDVDALYQFLKYIRETRLHDEVHKICSADVCFKTLLEQKRRESIKSPLDIRKRVESVEKFCLRI